MNTGTVNRRTFLRKALKASAGIAAGAGVLSVAAAYQCRVNRQTIALAGLPREFEGFRIALLSDFHHSSWIPRAHIRAAVQLANAQAPDLVALTGDFVDRGAEWVPGCIEELSHLRGRNGVVAVLGNHDYYGKAAPAMRDGLRSAGIEDLTNRGITLRSDGAGLRIGGVGDLWKENQKLTPALAGCDERESAIILTHNPDFTESVSDDRVGLVLAGHTHGGQFKLPFFGAPILPSNYGQKYASGLCHGPVARVFVTTGVGSSWPPVRVNCPAEVALITLTRGA
jgi:predicted MPP superfamily phosphohydrolase